MFKDIYDWISEESKDTGRDDMTLASQSSGDPCTGLTNVRF